MNHRKPNRLKEYDYSTAGGYFITVCAYNRECLFGEIIDGQTRLNECGKIVQDEWKRSAVIRREIKLDEFIVMPNHIHGIIWLTDMDTGTNGNIAESNVNVGATGRSPLHGRVSKRGSSTPHGPSPRSLGSFIAGFKSVVTKRINELRQMPEVAIWQRNYYDHVIRDDISLNKIRKYIVNNPANWDTDEENVKRLSV